MRESWNTYNAVADSYDGVRPRYPAAVYEAIEDYRRPVDGPRVLEVGVGTGQATVPMLRAGWRVTGVEPGGDLASIAERRCADYPAFSVVRSSFEDYRPGAGRFDLLVSATAWHWVDADVAYDRAASLLAPGATIALWWNAHVPDTDDPRWAPVRRAYERVAPELAVLARLTPDRPDYDPAGEVADSGRFTEVEQRVIPFEVQYSTARFLELIGTYASHRGLSDGRRARLHDELRSRIDGELAGTVTKPYEAVLVLGRRADKSAE